MERKIIAVDIDGFLYGLTGTSSGAHTTVSIYDLDTQNFVRSFGDFSPNGDIALEVVSVPEPVAIWLFSSGLFMLLILQTKWRACLTRWLHLNPAAPS